MNSHPGWTSTASLLAIAFAVLLWTVGRQRWPRVIIGLIIAGVGGLVDTTAGHLAHAGVTAANHQIDRGSVALFGAVIAWAFALWALGVVIFHLVDDTIGRWTIVDTVYFVVAAVFIPGPFGEGLTDLIGFATNLVADLTYFLFHGHF